MTGHLRKNKLKGNKHSYSLVVETHTDPITGRRHKEYRTFRNITKKQAEKKLREFIDELENGRYVKGSKITLIEFMDDWMTLYIEPFKAKTTIKSYKIYINAYIKPTIGNVQIQNLKPFQIQEFYNSFMNETTSRGGKRSPYSLKKLHLILKAALDKAVDVELINSNPALKVSIKKCERYDASVYSSDELKGLLHKVTGSDLEVPVNLLVGLGIRRGELCGLSWNDFDFENKTVTISKSLAQVGHDLFLKEPKTKNGKRTIAVPETLIKLLKKHKVNQNLSKLKYGEKYIDNEMVICYEDGSYYRPDTLTRRFSKFIKDNNMKKIRLHDLRHSHATVLLSMGVSAKVAQQRLGHGSVATTLDIYSHVLDNVQQETAEQFDNEIFNTL